MLYSSPKSKNGLQYSTLCTCSCFAKSFHVSSINRLKQIKYRNDGELKVFDGGDISVSKNYAKKLVKHVNKKHTT